MTTQVTIVDSDAGTDPDDTAVAIMVARAAHRFGVRLMISNDETTTFAKARFLSLALELAGAPELAHAAGLPSIRQRTTDLADDAGLVPARDVATDGVDRIVALLEAHERVTYVGLGALTNLDAALARRPELATRVALYQMGPAIARGFARGRAQYNARIDPAAFRRVLERVPVPTLIATHTTWGAPAPAPPLGVYPHDELGRAIAASPRPDLQLYTRHLTAFVASGKDCSILHDPATLLAATGHHALFDLVELEVVVDEHGWLHLTADAVATLRALHADRLAAVATAIAAWEPPPDGTAIRVRLSLSADQPGLRRRIAALLLSGE